MTVLSRLVQNASAFELSEELRNETSCKAWVLEVALLVENYYPESELNSVMKAVLNRIGALSEVDIQIVAALVHAINNFANGESEEVNVF